MSLETGHRLEPYEIRELASRGVGSKRLCARGVGAQPCGGIYGNRLRQAYIKLPKLVFGWTP